ncbi:MAG: histidinol dehydrogenase [Deltaproteobacteria bacterium]|jgi:histidinol dehydrogenase
MRVLTYPGEEAEVLLERIVNRSLSYPAELEQTVVEIIQAVQTEGDSALLRYTRHFDAPGIKLDELKVRDSEMKKAAEEVDSDFSGLVQRAQANIAAYHQAQRRYSWFMPCRDGSILGQMFTPVATAGLYIPGGRAGETPLISSLLMNSIPAIIAGVPRLQVVTPPRRDGSINPHLLVATQLLGIREVFKVGSAWAIAALAFGTETIPAVDLIAGPGNIYVALAKKLLAGQVGIDMLAGPSEILVIADSSANPRHVAADLLSQAEHDPMASALLLTPDAQLAEATVAALEEQLAQLRRGEVAEKSLSAFGGIVLLSDLDSALALANKIAPEHLELLVEQPFQLLGRIQNAGAVFLGHHSPEPVGDYFAGPNHVLPTAGTARFASGLSVDHFIKKTSVISYSSEALRRDAADIMRLAELEGLEGHARSVKVRLEKG